MPRFINRGTELNWMAPIQALIVHRSDIQFPFYLPFTRSANKSVSTNTSHFIRSGREDKTKKRRTIPAPTSLNRPIFMAESQWMNKNKRERIFITIRVVQRNNCLRSLLDDIEWSTIRFRHSLLCRRLAESIWVSLACMWWNRKHSLSNQSVF